MIGQEPADGFRQHVNGEDIVLEDVVDHVLGDQRFTGRLVEGAGKNDGRDRQVDQIFERLAVFRTRQIDVGNRQRHRIGGALVALLQLLERAADFDGDTHIGVFRQQNTIVRKRYAGILHSGNSEKVHVPKPPSFHGKNSRDHLPNH